MPVGLCSLVLVCLLAVVKCFFSCFFILKQFYICSLSLMNFSSEPTSADASEFIDRCCGYIRLAHLLLSQRSIAADQPAVSAYIFAHASYLPHLVSGHRVRVSRLAISHSISGGLYALAHSLIQVGVFLSFCPSCQLCSDFQLFLYVRNFDSRVL